MHATFTTVGGFLVAEDFVTLSSSSVLASLMVSDYFSCFDQQSQELCLQWCIRAVGVAWAHGRRVQALSDWIKAEHKIASAAANCSKGVRNDARKLLKQMLEESGEGGLNCPCGRMREVESMSQHWKDKQSDHSWW